MTCTCGTGEHCPEHDTLTGVPRSGRCGVPSASGKGTPCALTIGHLGPHLHRARPAATNQKGT